MQYLPNEILENIVKNLSYKDLTHLSITCKDLYHDLNYYKEEKKKYISWKLVIHLINVEKLPNERYIVDKSWVILGSSASYQDFMNGNQEYCSDCEEANYVITNDIEYFKHGDYIIQSSDILTITRKGIGGEFLDYILKNINGGQLYLKCLTDSIDSIDFVPTSIDENVKVNLKINDISHKNYTTNEVHDYIMYGIYVDPYGMNMDVETSSSEDHYYSFDYFREN